MLRLALSALLAAPLLAVRADSLETSNSSSWWTGAVDPVQTFYSSDLTPPEFNRITYDESEVGQDAVLLSYRGTGTSQPAPLIMNGSTGALIWSGHEDGYTNSMDLRVQTYKNESVLTFFQGDFFSGGYGNGSWYILSNNYTKIREVYSLNQTAQTSDFHEFVLTDNGTALVESWNLAEADLTAAGGSGTGWTWSCRFQEIQLGASPDEDELLFQWDSISAGVDPSESYFTVSDGAGNSTDNPFDSCHINSLEKHDTDNGALYLVSMRGPSTVYAINGTTGEIQWRLSGKYSNFTMGTSATNATHTTTGVSSNFSTDATFWYQHDARLYPGDDINSSKFRISLFDNAAGGGAPAEPTARAIVLELDTSSWTAELVWEGIPSFDTVADSQGAHRIDDEGRHFVGWGATPYFTEYDSHANIIQDVAFGTTDDIVMSYRAFKQAWSGYPWTSPSLAVNSSSAYASWNGATDVVSWTLMGGSSESAVSTEVVNVAKSGFETELAGLNGTYTFLAVAALSSDGTCLGVSPVYSTSSMSSTSTNGTCPSGSTVAAAGTNGTSTASGSGSSGSSGASGRSVMGWAVAAVAMVAAVMVQA
ncbi:hypothetical protein JCM8097_005428 [Rhodosporidiobolus ruineniae]